MPSSTLAAIGLSRVSNASSATAKLVSFTGTTRDLPQIEQDERQVGRADLDLAGRGLLLDGAAR